MAEVEHSKEEEQPAEASGREMVGDCRLDRLPREGRHNGGKLLRSCARAAPAHDAHCPPQPRLERDASSRVRGTGKSRVEIPSAWSCCGGARARGTLGRV